jgi:hypothetical protein
MCFKVAKEFPITRTLLQSYIKISAIVRLRRKRLQMKVPLTRYTITPEKFSNMHGAALSLTPFPQLQ